MLDSSASWNVKCVPPLTSGCTEKMTVPSCSPQPCPSHKHVLQHEPTELFERTESRTFHAVRCSYSDAGVSVSRKHSDMTPSSALRPFGHHPPCGKPGIRPLVYIRDRIYALYMHTTMGASRRLVACSCAIDGMYARLEEMQQYHAPVHTQVLHDLRQFARRLRCAGAFRAHAQVAQLRGSSPQSIFKVLGSMPA